MAKLRVYAVHSVCEPDGSCHRRRKEYRFDWTHPVPPTIGMAFLAKLDGKRQTVRIYDLTADLTDGTISLRLVSYAERGDDVSFIAGNKPGPLEGETMAVAA
jgi:hypothetical protein